MEKRVRRKIKKKRKERKGKGRNIFKTRVAK